MPQLEKFTLKYKANTTHLALKVGKKDYCQKQKAKTDFKELCSFLKYNKFIKIYKKRV